jgi:hypothetical protein
LEIQPLLICAEPRSTGQQLLEVLNEGWQGREVNLVFVLYDQEEYRPDNAARQRSQNRVILVTQEIGNLCIPCVEGSSPLGARQCKGRSDTVQYVQGPPQWGD